MKENERKTQRETTLFLTGHLGPVSENGISEKSAGDEGHSEFSSSGSVSFDTGVRLEFVGPAF